MSHLLPRPDTTPAHRPRHRAQVLRGALLGNLQDAAEAIGRCVANRDKEALFGPPALREEMMAALEMMRESVLALPDADKADMPDVPWARWEAMHFSHSGPAREWRNQVWSVIQELVPTTLKGVARYRSLLDDGQDTEASRPRSTAARQAS
ncbi:MAG: hypothetical protein PHI64_17490 [Zoogloea sp.]|uniref:hypothetical protein n=1 Tax=Zoogloea sp. TaxID=49181 RepID=UPI0026048E00|nr:hypothetical protein [Zoogloea sp.]MDD2990739.1 hypothetical protein [Zoogloea sp.]